MPTSQRLTRRRLLRLTAAAGALSLVPLTRSRELAGVVDGLGPPEQPTRAVSASLAKTSWRRVGGLRRLVLTLTTSESVSVDARLTRGATVLSRKSGNVAAGTRTVTLVLPRRIGAGGARVRLVLEDGAGNEKVVQRAVTVPQQ